MDKRTKAPVSSCHVVPATDVVVEYNTVWPMYYVTDMTNHELTLINDTKTNLKSSEDVIIPVDANNRSLKKLLDSTQISLVFVALLNILMHGATLPVGVSPLQETLKSEGTVHHPLVYAYPKYSAYSYYPVAYWVLFVVALAALVAAISANPMPFPGPYPAAPAPAPKETLKGAEAVYYSSYGALPYAAAAYPAVAYSGAAYPAAYPAAYGYSYYG
uniref:Uncharacterized protein n=1 Tax=Timema cristinae TaxID=61476 RepID=A0A7R9DF31_TIMCR|nr:unnamed protein product [Timema cristinae]